MTIETQRLILRPFCEADAEDVFEYLHKPAVNCFVDMKLDSLAQAKEKMIERAKDKDLYLAITLKENGKVIGEIFGLLEKNEHKSEDEPADTFSPSWMLNLNYTGKGYAYEAAHAYFDYLFDHKGIRRIYAYTDDYNLPSQKLCKKLGMRQEGFFKEFMSFVNEPDGTPHYENTYLFAILKKEWSEKNKH